MGQDNTFWRDPTLGAPRDIELSGGPMRVFEAGKGEPIVFVHGALVNANLWRKVVPRLSPDFRCITLDMPLGSHELPVPRADLSPTGIADMIAEAVEALGLEPADHRRERFGRRAHPDRSGRAIPSSPGASS